MDIISLNFHINALEYETPADDFDGLHFKISKNSIHQTKKTIS